MLSEFIKWIIGHLDQGEELKLSHLKVLLDDKKRFVTHHKLLIIKDKLD